MAGTGQAIGAGVGGFVAGLQLANQQEDRNLNRKRIEQQDARLAQADVRQAKEDEYVAGERAIKTEERGREKTLRELNSVYLAIRDAEASGSEVPEEIWNTDGGKALMAAADPSARDVPATFEKALKGDIPLTDPAVIKAVNTASASELAARKGQPLSDDVVLPDGRKFAKGTPMESAEISNIYPLGDGVAFELKIGVKGPNGIEYYTAPATEGGSASADAPVKVVSLRSLGERVHDIGQMSKLAADPKVKALLRQRIVANGGDPTAFDKKDLSQAETEAKIALLGARGETEKARQKNLDATGRAATTRAGAAVTAANRVGGGGGRGGSGQWVKMSDDTLFNRATGATVTVPTGTSGGKYDEWLRKSVVTIRAAEQAANSLGQSPPRSYEVIRKELEAAVPRPKGGGSAGIAAPAEGDDDDNGDDEAAELEALRQAQGG